MICYSFTPPSYIFFAEEAPLLLYYSHIPAIALSLIFATLIFFNNPKSTLNRLFASISVLFSAWALINLHLWTSIDADLMTFSWSMLSWSQALIAILSIQLAHIFYFKNEVGWKSKLVLFILLLPVALFAHTNANINGYNLSNCDAFGHENVWFHTYYHLLGAVAFIWILVLTYKRCQNVSSAELKKNLLFSFGLLCFILTFFSTIYVGAYLTEIGITSDSELDMYGLYGMIIFQAIITFLIVSYKVFNVSLSAARALVVALIILTASQLTFAESTAGVIFSLITVLLTFAIGNFLLRSVQKEIKQKEELEKITTRLADANNRLKELDKLKSEFVSIASHQMRSPLTSIRGYASMLIEQSFGPMPEKAMDPLKRIEDSARHMAMAVEDYLNVSRIESGNMKYNNSDFNLKDEAEKICDDIRPIAMEKQLVLLFRTDLKSKGIVNADVGKTVQIIHNLVNNSMKYTERGSITVFVRDDLNKKRIYIDITDTGIGISNENITKLFQKFSRATNANSVNVTGTGLGLFVARQMAVAMGGDITARSEGDGKGSTFTFELPLMM